MNLLKILRESIVSIVIISIFGVSYAALSSLTVSTNDTLTAQKWNDLVEHAVPSKSVMAFYDTACPTGWSIANGTNGTPDLRGEFIRGLDLGRGVDAGRTFGSFQGDAIRNIEGTFSHNSVNNVTAGSAITNVSGAFEFFGLLTTIDDIDENPNAGSNYKSAKFNASNVVPTASDNRPRNVALLYCMKN